MPALVSDVGGTNTRLALVDTHGRLSVAPRRYRNDDHDGFLSVAKTFLREEGYPDLTQACIAIAGPVSVKSARLTNRDWGFEAVALTDGLAVPSVKLINDIVALGYGLGALGPGQLAVLRDGGQPNGNGQRVVVGMGTGLNVCMAKDTGMGPVILEAEFGHSHLPVSVANRLDAVMPGTSTTFHTVEELLAGRGVGKLYNLMTGVPSAGGHDVAEHAETNPDAAACLMLAAELFGLLTRDIYSHYMPGDGIYFAGGVARTLLQVPYVDAFAEAFQMSGQFEQDLAQVPLLLITDDLAALAGCARALS
ncbi:MAG: glucokinase [Rhodobacteraceae bacterium]|nr:glucokinase [Paracoccaceae bacterium]